MGMEARFYEEVDDFYDISYPFWHTIQKESFKG